MDMILQKQIKELDKDLQEICEQLEHEQYIISCDDEVLIQKLENSIIKCKALTETYENS